MKFVTTLLSYISPQTVFKTTSKINRDIVVVERFGKCEIVVGGLQQSGWLVRSLWDKALAETQNSKLKTKNCLIFGLGGGAVVPVINRLYSDAKIVGVEIDPVMVDVGKRFFGLDTYKNLEVITANAFEIMHKKPNTSNHWTRRIYDVVLIDLYIGEDIPKKLKSLKFLKSLKKLVAKNGEVLINHLRGIEYERELKSFEKKLREVFDDVESVKPIVNQVFICKD